MERKSRFSRYLGGIVKRGFGSKVGAITIAELLVKEDEYGLAVCGSTSEFVLWLKASSSSSNIAKCLYL